MAANQQAANQPAANQQAANLPAFATSPATIFQGVWDFTNCVQLNIYTEGVKPLKSEFNGTAPKFKNIRERIAVYGWTGIFTVQVNRVNHYLPTHWGRVTIDQTQQNLLLVPGNQDRAYQNLAMSGQCLYNTLSTNAQNKVSPYANEYCINGVISRPILLRVIIAVTHVDTRATADQILTQLERLDEKMIAFNSDVQKFNQFVHKKLAELQAQGQEDHALLTHLFIGYEATSNEEFVMWAKRKHSDIDDGDDLEAEALMQLALCKYMDRVTHNLWSKPSAQGEHIIALQAKIGKLESSLQQKTTAKKDDAKSKEGKGKKGKNKAKKGKRKVEPWKLIAPIANQPKTKMVNGKTYYWCLYHNNNKGQWVVHNPNDPNGCRERARQQRNNQGNPSAQPTGVHNVSFNELLVTILEEDEDS